jgi:U4/U6 small nuclear ribonucleoprotein PRP31
VDLYKIKFPGLQDLVTNQEMYFRVVQCIGNSTDVGSCGVEALLPKTDAIRVVVSGSTSNDQPLPTDVMQRVALACETAISLFDARNEISDMVMDGMTAIAPNVTAMVGANVAAELIGLAGGLPELSRIPGGNMMLLGQQKKLDSGMSTSQQLHRGVIYKAPIILKSSFDLQRKVGRELANKVALAARVDSVHSAKDGSIGEKFLKKIENKYRTHWDAADVARTAKALPVPDAGEKKSRRGGRRKREWKKKYGLTDVHKDANRVSFGGQHDEYSDSAMGRTFGTLGQQGSGRIRKYSKVNQKPTLTKGAQRKLDRANAMLGKRKTQSSGLASSLVLDSDRGIEFVDPESARKKLAEVNSKYFGTKSGFRSVMPSKK